MPLERSGRSRRWLVKFPMRCPIIAALWKERATTAGNMDGPNNCNKTNAITYSGVERITTNITCPASRLFETKKSDEMIGKNSNDKTPVAAKAIIVSTTVLSIPGNASFTIKL